MTGIDGLSGALIITVFIAAILLAADAVLGGGK